jgi:sugar phosphate permease
MFMSGCNFYSFGLFVKPFQDDFGWSRADIMYGSTISTIINALTGLLVGKVLERWSPKRVLIAGALVSTISFVLMSTMQKLWQFYIFYGLSGFGFAGIGFIPVSAVILNWFKRRRGLAIGLAGVGIGVGGFFIPLLAGFLILNFTWRVAFLVLGIIISVVSVPLVLFVMRVKPEEMGLYADGAENPPEEVRFGTVYQTALEGLLFKEALKTPTFWLIAITGLIFGLGSQSIVQHQAAHLQDVGFPMAVAASALSGVGITNAIGKFFFGFICDWTQPKYARAMGLLFLLLAILALMRVNSSSSPAAIWLYVTVAGLAVGSWLPSMSMLVSTSFGLAAYGTIFAMTSLFHQIGGSAGPLIAGYIFDAQGTYKVAFTSFAILSAIAIVITLFIGKPGFTATHEGHKITGK